MIELKARCTGNAQSTNGSHLAALTAEDGITSFTVPSETLQFIPGEVYKVTVDGKFAKPPAKPAPAKYAGPERRTHLTPIAPPMKERRATPWNYPAPKPAPLPTKSEIDATA